jgi:hypothetical protein
MAWNWKLIGILTGATPDYGPEPSVIYPALGWSVIAVKLNRKGWVGMVGPQLDI